jgi:hypothetical protein
MVSIKSVLSNCPLFGMVMKDFSLSVFFIKTLVVSVACNDLQGLAMAWYSMNFPPDRQPIEKPKPKINTKS